MLNWANQFNICCFLDNHQYQFAPHTYECLLAVGAEDYVSSSAGDAFDKLRSFAEKQNDWLFGHLGYDLKNELEKGLTSSNPDNVRFPDLFFFIPKIIIRLDNSTMEISSLGKNEEEIMSQINSFSEVESFFGSTEIEIRSRFTKDEYLLTIEALKKHIHRGDAYEINFCQEFFCESTLIDPISIYRKLMEVSPNPFAVYYKLDDKFLLCASPERYLKKSGKKVSSQPVKGTSLRDHKDQKADILSREHLKSSSKERSENVMIVDLVRNDLSRICEEGSVKVDELYGVYPFPQVYQMISTISGEFNSDLHWIEAIRQTFPMGSMTGAPKKKVMELIEKYERSRRGIFSGAVGYITPDSDFDFNVVIRSLMYNMNSQYLSFQAGSGITFYSEPEKEYLECLLKIEAIKKVLT